MCRSLRRVTMPDEQNAPASAPVENFTVEDAGLKMPEPAPADDGTPADGAEVTDLTDSSAKSDKSSKTDTVDEDGEPLTLGVKKRLARAERQRDDERRKAD